MKCNKCGTINDHEAVYCGNCGEFILEGKKLCFNCREVTELNADYCPKCNAFLKTGYTLCRKCGKENSLEFTYCTKCKTKLISSFYIQSNIIIYSIAVFLALQLFFIGSMFLRTNVSSDGPTAYVNILDNQFSTVYLVFFTLTIFGLFFLMTMLYRLLSMVKKNSIHQISRSQKRVAVYVLLSFFVAASLTFFLDITLLNSEYVVVNQDGATRWYSEYIGLQLPKMILSFGLIFLLPAIVVIKIIYVSIKNNIKL